MCRLLLEVLFLPALLLVGGSEAAAQENPLRFIRHEEATVLIDDDIEVVAAPVYLNGTRWVTVTWKNVPNPSNDDWIGLWVLWNSTEIDPKAAAPVKYQLCSMSKTHLETGAGQFQFYMVNMKSPYQFGLLRQGLVKPVLAAHSTNLRFPNYNEPLQIHFSLTKSPTEMVMMFVTLNNSSPEVKWGEVSGQLDNVKKASVSSYSADDMCDTPATDFGFMSPGTINTMVMEGLTPGAKYYYQCGSAEGTGGYSAEQVFIAPPTPGPTVTTKILAFGDLGHGQMDDTRENIRAEPPSLNTTKRMAAEVNDHDFVMHIGDICYAEGFGSTWEEFFDQLQPLMTRLPYMVNPGNHESDSSNSHSYYKGHDSGGECSIPYVKRFHMPRMSDDQPWYDFEYGSVHVVMMSTEHDFRNTSKQWSDLVKSFESVDRSITPWLIFSGHRPMYVDSMSESGDASDQVVAKLLREHVEPLLFKYKVDLALWGHHHSYQRTCPVYALKCTPGAPVHVVIGMAGQGLSHNLRETKPPYFEIVDDQHYGYTRLVATPTTLSMEFIKNVDGTKGDSFTLTKQ